MPNHNHSGLFSIALIVGIVSIIAFFLLATAVYTGAF